MMRRPNLAVLIAIVAAAPAFAQGQGSVPRAISLADTMGANFAVADSLTASSNPTDGALGLYEEADRGPGRAH